MGTPAESLAQAPLLGTLFTMFLYGIGCMQVFYYLQNYQEDRVGMKILVAVVWTLETLHTILSIYFVEFYLIVNFSNEGNLFHVNWGVPVSFIVGFLVAFIVNVYFIWRFWRLSRNMIFSTTLLVLAIARLAIGWMNSVLAIKDALWEDFRAKTFASIVAGYVLSVLTDALLAVALCWLLRNLRTGVKRTDNMIDNLLIYTINTGVLTSIGALVVLILFLCLPTSLAFIGVLQVQTKLYGISFLASLNSRNSMLNKAKATRQSSIRINNFVVSRSHNNANTKRGNTNPINHIEIHKTMETINDVEMMDDIAV